MKSRIYLFGVVIATTCIFSACQSKQSAYQHVYEAAQARSTVNESAKPATANAGRNTGGERTKPATATFQSEKIMPVDGMSIKQYSVVIGSFINKTNAESLRNRMQVRGYQPVLAKNEKDMYRVIVATFDNKTDAYSERDAVRDRYPDEFGDAWLLERAY